MDAPAPAINTPVGPTDPLLAGPHQRLGSDWPIEIGQGGYTELENAPLGSASPPKRGGEGSGSGTMPSALRMSDSGQFETSLKLSKTTKRTF